MYGIVGYVGSREAATVATVLSSRSREGDNDTSSVVEHVMRV